MLIKKMISIFTRDLRVSARSFIPLYIMILPVVYAVLINVFIPGIAETTINLALIEGENRAQEEYLHQFANVILVEDELRLEERVLERDDVIGVLRDDDGYSILSQGDEPDYMVDFANTLVTLEEYGADVASSNATIRDFGRTMNPMKKMFANALIMLSSVLGGMLIAINIIDEKSDNTIRAITVTPLPAKYYILGKSMIGILLPIFGILIMLVLTGFRDINFLQVIVMMMTSSIISILVGFIEGINSDDIMKAAGNIKILFLPLMASIAGIELLADKWQVLFYWIPFYWTYKGNELVLGGDGSWSEILLYAGIVLALSGAVFLLLAPRIRKGLQ